MFSEIEILGDGGGVTDDNRNIGYLPSPFHSTSAVGRYHIWFGFELGALFGAVVAAACLKAVGEDTGAGEGEDDPMKGWSGFVRNQIYKGGVAYAKSRMFDWL